MNQVIISGRLTRDPEVRYSQGENSLAIARFNLAVDRKTKKEGDNADYISCVAFGKSAEFFEKYVKQGTKMVIRGHVQTGSYTNKDGQKVYTTDVVVEESEFAESKNNNSSSGSESQSSRPAPSSAIGDGFMNIPEGLDEELPFN